MSTRRLSERIVKPRPGYEKRIVLHADPDTISELRITGSIKLRLFCEQGSSVLVDLHNKAPTPRATGSIGLVTLNMDRKQMVEALEPGVNVFFIDSKGGNVVPFRTGKASVDSWLGQAAPFAEKIMKC